MESWQRDYISSNIARLVENTICDTNLLLKLRASGMLHNSDIDKIESRHEKQERSRLLIDIAETRRDGFIKLTKCLSECKQSGAFVILMEGIIQQVLSELNVQWCGDVIPLSFLLSEEQIANIEQRLKSAPASDLLLNVCVNVAQSDDNTINLVNDSIPPADSLYIPRSLSKRLVLNSEIFKLESADVFVFRDVDRKKLPELDTIQFTSSALEFGQLTTRFILLDHEDDWKEIRLVAKVPVHLIKYDNESGSYMLEDTSGGSRILSRFLVHPEHSSDGKIVGIISEKDLIDEVIIRDIKGLCMCDLPGMGKSLLLANIARNVAEKCSDRVVSFIQLSHFSEFLTSKRVFSGADISRIRKCLIEYISPSPLAAEILDEILGNEDTHLELFFDAFDEVQLRHVDFMKDTLITIAKRMPLARIYVASRPHLRHELETVLGATAYDILPFNKENQIEFLSAFWNNFDQPLDKIKLKEFGNFCLGYFATHFSPEENDITGIPLQCRLFGEVYSKYARRYAHPNREIPLEECCQFETTLSNVYRRYMELRFSNANFKFDATKPSIDLSTAPIWCTRLMEIIGGENVCGSEIRDIKMVHVFVALKTLFPFGSDAFGSYAVTSPIDRRYLSVGLLTQSFNGNAECFEFLHRTFAEHLASEYFVQVLLSSNNFLVKETKAINKYLTELIFECVMATKPTSYSYGLNADYFVSHGLTYTDEGCTFLYPDVLYFLNANLKYAGEMTPCNSVVSTFCSSVTPGRLLGILEACIFHNFSSIFQLLCTILLKAGRLTICYYQMHVTVDRYLFRHFLNVAAGYGTVALAEQVLHLFSDVFRYNVSKGFERWPHNTLTPIHYALRAVKPDMVKYFVDKISIDNRRLLYFCIEDSHWDTAQEVEKIIEMVKVLLRRSRRLLTEGCVTIHDIKTCGGPLVGRGIHLNVIKFLIKDGADVRATCYENTIFDCAEMYMHSGDYVELCNFLSQNCEVDDLLNEKKERDTYLPKLKFGYVYFPAIDIMNMRMELLEYVGDRTSDISTRDKGNEFLSAAKDRQDVEVLKNLVEKGVDYKASNGEGRNALHLAVGRGNGEMPNVASIRYLLSLQVDLTQQDSEGETPIDVAINTLWEYKLLQCHRKGDLIGRQKDVIKLLEESKLVILKCEKE